MKFFCELLPELAVLENAEFSLRGCDDICLDKIQYGNSKNVIWRQQNLKKIKFIFERCEEISSHNLDTFEKWLTQSCAAEISVI